MYTSGCLELALSLITVNPALFKVPAWNSHRAASFLHNKPWHKGRAVQLGAFSIHKTETYQKWEQKCMIRVSSKYKGKWGERVPTQH